MSLNQTPLNRTGARFSGPSDLADKFVIHLGNVKSDFACISKREPLTDLTI